MTSKVLNGTTLIDCHIIAHNKEDGLALAVSKHIGKVFVCYSDQMADDSDYVVIDGSDKNREWTFIK